MTFPTSRLAELGAVFRIEELPLTVVRPAPVPLVLSAHEPGNFDQIDDHLAQAIAQELVARAVILVRGLDAAGSDGVARLADQIFASQPPFSTGEHPQADGHASLYQPVRFAPTETLLWHHENSFNADWPRYVMFACARPADSGGQTTIVDSRLVHEQMPDEIRARLAHHGIRYERLCDGRTGRRWEQIYETTDQHLAQRQAEANGEELVFTTQGARIHATRPAFLSVAHGTSWFNQLLHWHPHALPPELRDMTAARLIPTYRTCRFGDGSPIPPDAIDQLIEAHRTIEFAVPWNAGDVLLIDNTIIAHGRRPFHGPRQHFVRMAGSGVHHRTAIDPS